MEGDRFNRVVEVMARMAAGDRAAVFVLYYEFGAPIGAALRRQLRAMGVERIRNEDLDGLVIDACMEIEICAGAWSPTGGALPWTWAGARLRNVVTRHVGVHTDPLDEQEAVDVAPVGERGAVEAAPASDPEEVEVLAALAAIDDSCALLHEALAEVASPRDRALVVELGARCRSRGHGVCLRPRGHRRRGRYAS